MDPGGVARRRREPVAAAIDAGLTGDAAAGADTAVWLLACPDASEHPGAFWQDRRPRSPNRLPGTRAPCSIHHRQRPASVGSRSPSLDFATLVRPVGQND